MRIFVAGATGTIGRRLIPLLVAAGHDVTGMSRSRERAEALYRLGARGAVADVYDRDRLREVLREARPEVVIDELSDLPRQLGAGGGFERLVRNWRMRTEGTRSLVEAAAATGVRRVVAQSYAHIYAPRLGWVKHEDDPLYLSVDAPSDRRRTVESVQELERLVLETPGLEGVALRYGSFYGPDTPFAWDGSIAEDFRRQRYPVVGGGNGRTSFVHVDDAAAATVLALDAPRGVYNICDDRPAREAEWAPFYAGTLGAPAPRHEFPFSGVALGRERFVYQATLQRGASNAKAKRVLGWELCFPSWREGFVVEARREREALRPRVA